MNTKKPYKDEPIITAKKILKHKKLLKTVPDSFIISSFDAVLQLMKHYKIRRACSIISAKIFVINISNTKIGIACPSSIGAPAIAMVAEELAASGANRLILVGATGALQQNLNAGSAILPTNSLREESISCHYANLSKYATPSPGLSKILERSLKENRTTFTKGGSWTTDAFYRETMAKAKRYQKEGVLCVEMEASALFSVAKHCNTEASALLYVTDSLAGQKWQPYFNSEEVKKSRLMLLKVAIDALCMAKNPLFNAKPLKLNLKGIALSNMIKIAQKLGKLTMKAGNF